MVQIMMLYKAKKRYRWGLLCLWLLAVCLWWLALPVQAEEDTMSYHDRPVVR
jgi:hypothetical protein